jgi:hypothetical protein
MSRNDQPPQGGSPDPVYQRLAWLAERRPADPSVIQEAVAERRAAEAAALRKPQRTAEDPPTGNDSLWISLGPAAVLRGAPFTKPRVSGRVRALAVHPDGQRAYAGTANGGVWYSDDAGASWLPVGLFATERGGATKGATGAAGAEGFAVGGLAVRFGAAADGSGDDVLVGTGELDRSGGVGVLHATGPVPVVRADKLADPWTREAKNLVGLGVFRLARHPDHSDRNPDDLDPVVAATSRGLFQRALPAAADSDWRRVTAAPFSADDTATSVRVTDVAWVKPPGAAGTRLWIALDDQRAGPDGGQSGLWVADVDAAGDVGTFAQVELDGLSPNARIGVAAAAPPSRLLYVLSVTEAVDPKDPNRVLRMPRLWRIDDATSPPTVRRVERVPAHLFGGPRNDQHYWDLTIAVDPTDANRVMLGGSLLPGVGREWAAALFVCKVQAGGRTGFQLSYNKKAGEETSDPTWCGQGVHPDVHAAVFARSSRPAAERDLWIGCDGGVFVSHRSGDRDSFVARNTGIASLEVGYIAGNPASDVEVLAGTQDNGTIRRIGASVWEVRFYGDGGGLVYDPGQPDRFVYQTFLAEWHDHTGTLLRFVFRPRDTEHPPSAERAKRIEEAEKAENEASSFYSDADAVVTGGRTLLAIGTNRVWVSDDWGADGSWVTLPSGRDPKGANPADTTTDLCVPTGTGAISPDSTVVTLRWSPPPRHTSGPLRLLVLCQGAVIVHHISDDPAPTTPRLTSRAFRVEQIADGGRIEQYGSAGLALHHLPRCTWTDAVWHDRDREVHGSFYVATAGPWYPAAPDPPDTLWWFDGKDTWFATGLRSSPQGTKAPAYAVVVDPDDQSIVYVGTGAGVWRGSFDVTNRTWSWVVFSNGLPEAIVADLEILKVGAVKLLRAGLQALGVFEVDLTGPTPPRTFLRVHDLDSRRAPPLEKDPRVSPPVALRWEASPDIRPRMDTGAPAPTPPANAAQHITDPPATAFDKHRLWVFQTALRRIDPLVRADGTWSADFERRMLARRKAAGIPATPTPRVDGPIWTNVVTPARRYAPPWDDPAPTEADLLELVVDRPAPAGDLASLALTRGRAKVEVLVHHRHVLAVDAGRVRVVLLRHALAASRDIGKALRVTFTAKVAQALASGNPPTGGWGSLPDGWTVADTATPLRSPALPVHPRTPRAVGFDIDFSTSPPNSRWILVAVAASTLDPAAFTGANLRDLVLRSRCVAARTVRLV